MASVASWRRLWNTADSLGSIHTWLRFSLIFSVSCLKMQTPSVNTITSLLAIHTIAKKWVHNPLLPPANEVCEGYVFTCVCLSTPWQVHPPGRYTPCAGTPLGQVHPPGQVHPCKAGTPREQCILGDTGNKRAVRILLECSLVELSAHKKMWMRPLSTVEPII